MSKAIANRLLSAILAFCLIVSTIAPLTVYAAETGAIEESGTISTESVEKTGAAENGTNSGEGTASTDTTAEGADSEEDTASTDTTAEGADSEEDTASTDTTAEGANSGEGTASTDTTAEGANGEEGTASTDTTAEGADSGEGTVSADTTNESTGNAEDTEDTEEGTQSTEDTGAIVSDDDGDGADTEEPAVADYATFLENLKILEGYADSYAAANTNYEAGLLLLNFLRTGVDRYNDGNWKTLAGEEITEFTAYVEAQDAANSTTAMILRNIDEFTIPNGQGVDFGHMFGTMNIAYVSATASADLGGWAGDICDLMMYSKDYGYVPEGTVEEKAAYILEKCFGVDADDAFGMDDFYGDMDAFYLIAQMKAGTKLSAAMEAYFTTALTDSDRAAYFLNNRFSNLETKEDIRTVIYDTYSSNVGLQVLEASRGLSEDADLRTACCYAFADYLFSLAGDRLEGGSDDEEPEEELAFTIFSTSNSTLAPGITQSVNYALNKSNEQFVYYLATIDINRDDVNVYANYKDNDPSAGWGMQRVTDQMEAAEAAHSDPEDTENYVENYTAVAGINADFYNMSNGQPSGALVMEGVTYNAANGKNFFAILDDGTPVIGSGSEWSSYQSRVKEAIGGSILLLKDGEIVAASGNYYTTSGCRSVVGITEDGKVLMLVVDGRQAPFSVGATAEETAQILLAAGCVDALHLDGGGSATYAAKPEGSDTIKVVSSPSDGYARSVSSSLVAVSTAKSSKEFDHANITCAYDYMTIGTALQLSASGVSNTGNSAPMPEGTSWKVSDEKIGSITADGVFTAADNGDVQVQLMLEGEVVGTKTLHVVVPDAMQFEKDAINAIYGVPTELPLQMSYSGNPVAFNNADVWVLLENETAGTIEGITFIGSEESGIRTVMVGALLLANQDIMAFADINLYKDGEAFFDFDDVTAGNRTLAWNRDVSNSTTDNEVLYHISNVDETMDITYVFGLDMETIEIPEQLADLTYMLPGADAGSTAWEFLLQLAERVSVLTEVRVTAQFDADLDVDCSEVKVVNEYFYLKSATLDEKTNTLTIICGWVDQTMAIDPATANPICILSGIKVTPKEDASWDEKNQLAITNLGDVSYKIYLRANALYNFANITSNQEKYSLYPFENPAVIVDGANEKGAYFGSSYATFEDSFVLDKTNRQGWYEANNELYYYVNNVRVTGLQLVPGYEDASATMIYQFDENGVCTGAVSGLVEIDGGKYYSINGAVRTGWQTIANDEGELEYYYFDPKNGGKAVDGEQVIVGFTYQFEDCVLIRGDLRMTSGGPRYRWAGRWDDRGWITIDGDQYYAQSSGYLLTGLAWKFDLNGDWRYCVFNSDGRFMEEVNGFYDYNGNTYLVKEGFVVQYPGLVLVDGDYYYFTSKHVMVKGRTYWISKPNGLLPEKSYTFGPDGKMIIETVTPTPDPDPNPSEPEVEVKNGIVEENGDLYYYVNGVRKYAGLIKIGEDYYYVNSSYRVVHDCTYYISLTNNLMPRGSYKFGSDGKMIIETETPDPETPVKNGIVEEDGDLYYYVNGVRKYAGLIKIGEDYYYVNSSCKVIHDRTYYISLTNNLLPRASYKFGSDGKMIRETETPDPSEPEVEVKNGIVEEDGVKYYYVNGVKKYAGLIQIDGDYYYVNSSCQVICGRKYYISLTNNLLPRGYYTFDADGKMVQ